jgi:hypothetical protein
MICRYILILNKSIVSLRYCEAKGVSAYDLYSYEKGVYGDPSTTLTLLFLGFPMEQGKDNKRTWLSTRLPYLHVNRA